MGKLSEIAKQRSPFLKVLPGEEAIVTYKDFKMVPDSYNPDAEKFRFVLRVGDQIKYWDTGSNAAAMFFDGCEEGDIVAIKNVGEIGKSKWEFRRVVSNDTTDDGKKPTKA